MSLKHILLGFINIQSMTGYELKQLIDNSINNFWNVNLSQIYPTLGAMKEEELLDMEIQINEGTPNSKIYNITEKGRIELEKWMEETTPLPQTRKLFLAKLLVGVKFDKEILIKQVKEQLKLHQMALESLYKRLAGNTCNLPTTEDPEKYKLFTELVIDAGIKEEEASIAWCMQTIERLEKSN
ncbi:PadR family transcriptional regulator [Clostridium sp. YIM B02555]|uniref:PadR family transcriptional regulator n=1 Tax=Clostridium sp. YIM B02555 TaxID=2911968 RepID=UPI0023AFA1BC|nr:PadR family transcriptional regulator [Clostridium sp. YIM B02555]